MSASLNISGAPFRKRRNGLRFTPSSIRKRNGKNFRPVSFNRIPRGLVLRKPELKFFDASTSNTTTNAWVMTLSNVCSPAEGTGDQTRIGSKINIMTFNLRAKLSVGVTESQTVPQPEVITRIIVGISHQGGTVVTTDVVDTGATTDLLAYRNMDQVGDFTILKDFYMKVEPWVTNEGAINLFATGVRESDVITYSKHWKLGLQKTFAAGTTTATKNGIFIMVISNSTGATLVLELRTRYTDV